MVTLSLGQMETAVNAAFDAWLNQRPNNFTIQIGGHNVQVTINTNGGRFDCGVPGYQMANADVQGLKQWVGTNIVAGNDVGGLTPCKNVGGTGQVHVILLARVQFNFHVNLVNPC